jgi:hypothetical protein
MVWRLSHNLATSKLKGENNIQPYLCNFWQGNWVGTNIGWVFDFFNISQFKLIEFYKI